MVRDALRATHGKLIDWRIIIGGAFPVLQVDYWLESDGKAHCHNTAL
jgi:hypothetical protein